jgi:arginase family enzyme
VSAVLLNDSHLVTALPSQGAVVGGDVVEVAPAYDHAELTSLAGANVVYELLALLARQATSSLGNQPGA